MSVHSSEMAPPPASPMYASVAPPLGPKWRGDTPVCGGRDGGDPISAKEQKLWYSVCTIIPLRLLFSDI